MKTSVRLTVLAVGAALLVFIPTHAQAQDAPAGGPPQGGGFGRGNFNPEEMRQRMMDMYKERMEVKSDDEWKVIQPRIQKVMDARRDVGFGGGMRGMFGPGGRRGGDQGGGDQNAQPRRANFGGQPSPAAQALQRAIDTGASKDDIKAKLEAYREEREQKKAALEKAQGDLKKVLTTKQEAVAVLAGLLD